MWHCKQQQGQGGRPRPDKRQNSQISNRNLNVKNPNKKKGQGRPDKGQKSQISQRNLKVKKFK